MGFQRQTGMACSACGGGGPRLDALTGLADRSGFNDAVTARLAAHRTSQDPAASGFAVLLLDLDRFKAVNDSLGHGAGDALLTAVGKRLKRAIRESDVAARLGGDEFAILLDAPAGLEVVAGIAARIIALVSQVYLVEGRAANVGVSVGASLASAGAESAGLLVQQADMAMYQAKAEGTGKFRLFDPLMQERARARQLLESELRAALPLQQFELFYQPQLRFERDRLSGFEALLRWRHPEQGIVPPDRFIPVAEELRLIDAIGEWVLQAACEDAAGWSDDLCVAVNVAAQQFEAGSLVAAVATALRRSGLASKRLEIEITESALLMPGTDTLGQLQAIKDMGVQISLDDFGTGYSSLTQLRSFPFDRVKIDRSFVDDDPVVRAVAALSHNLGIRTTVEGVETVQQLERLRASGCTEVQGYLLSRPVAANQVGKLIRRFGDAEGDLETTIGKAWR